MEVYKWVLDIHQVNHFFLLVLKLFFIKYFLFLFLELQQGNYWIFNNNLQRSFLPSVYFELSAELYASVYLLAKTSMVVDYIGGPFISTKIYGENILKAGKKK